MVVRLRAPTEDVTCGVLAVGADAETVCLAGNVGLVVVVAGLATGEMPVDEILAGTFCEVPSACCATTIGAPDDAGSCARVGVLFVGRRLGGSKSNV